MKRCVLSLTFLLMSLAAFCTKYQMVNLSTSTIFNEISSKKAATSDTVFSKVVSQTSEDGESPEEMCNVGIKYYDEGKYHEAAEWLEKASNQGHAKAQYNLGRCYYNGQGVVPNYEKAAYWYEKAANQGYADAQNNLGVCYANGEGVVQSYEKAVYWFEKAANQGDAKAQCNLGSCYYNGQGVVPNYEKAAYWYEKAANQGYAPAQYLV